MHWDEPLTRTLTLKSGECLTTLREVARALASAFDKPPRWTVLDHAMEATIRAAESGGAKEITRDQVLAAVATIFDGRTTVPVSDGYALILPDLSKLTPSAREANISMLTEAGAVKR